MRSSTIKNNFTSGELTPLMYGRTELEPYQKGLAECLNMRVLRHGGVTRRNGTKHLGEVKDSSKTVRLIPFVFSDNDSLMLEMGDKYIRFWDTAGRMSGSTEKVINGDFPTDLAGWTQVVTGSSSINWNAFYQAAQLVASGGTAKLRQTLTGVASGNLHTFSFYVHNFLGSLADKPVRIGTTLGGSEILLMTPVLGVNSISVTPTAATIYLEFEASISTIVIDDVSLISSVAVLEVTTPFLEADLFSVMYAQSNDFIWFTHRNYPPQVLIRTSTSPIAFTISDAVIKQGPFAPLNETTIIMTLTIGSGWTKGDTGTCTSGLAYFESTDVGEYLIIYDDDDLTIFGILLITGFTSTTIVSAEWAIDIPTELQTGSNSTWAIQAIGDRNGYPAAVTFHDQRLIYAGTENQPQNIWGSTIADFETFSAGTNDDDHFDYLLASTKQNAIFWLAVKHDLIIGTVSNEWGMRGGGLEDPITPSNVVTRPYRSEGSIRVQPEELNDLITFIQRAGHKVIGLAYNEDTRTLSTTDLMLLSEHLTVSSIVTQLSYQSERESILWCVTSIGQLLGMTYDVSQAILAWHQHTTGASGQFESVATIPVSDADQTWVIVKRIIDGNVVKYIEYLDDKDWRVDDDPFYVDSGISYNGAAATVMTGLDHLEGENVVVYAGGEFVGEFTVASGQVTLDSAVTQAHIGLDYLSTFTELPEGSNSQDGSAHTRQKRKAKVDLRLYKTQGIVVNGDVRDLPRDASATKPELFSGIIDSSNLGWDTDAANTVSSIGPNPLTVLAIRSTLLMGNE